MIGEPAPGTLMVLANADGAAVFRATGRRRWCFPSSDKGMVSKPIWRYEPTLMYDVLAGVVERYRLAHHFAR